MIAIALKTRSPVLSTTAFIPLIGPAYLAHTLRSDHKPEDTIDRLAKDTEVASDKQDLPTFRHGLLNYDWAPELHVGKLDMDMFKQGRDKFSGIFELIWTADDLKRQRKAEASAKKRKEASEHSRKKKARAKEAKQMRRDEEERNYANRRKKGR